jgi:hypothetical protein
VPLHPNLAAAGVIDAKLFPPRRWQRLVSQFYHLYLYTFA